nr:MAG TPA: hypothetical protein [Caudoviricetes sp.]
MCKDNRQERSRQCYISIFLVKIAYISFGVGSIVYYLHKGSREPQLCNIQWFSRLLYV